MHAEDDRDLVRAEPDEVARRIDAEQLGESPDQVLIELRAFVALQHREDAVARERLLIGALGAHRVVDVGNRAHHRAEVHRLALHGERIAAAVEAQVMLEGDDRRQDRHLRRPPQNLGAVDDVPPHDHELVVGQLAGLVEDFLRRADLADVVHQGREAELAQQLAVDAERARLGHRQDRHVHHVRERVVVVVLQRGERQQRRAILRHRLRERIDDPPAGVRIGLAFDMRGVPQPLGDGDRIAVQPLERRDVVGQPVDGLERRRRVGHAFGLGALDQRFGRGHGAGVHLPDRGDVAGDAVLLPVVAALEAADADVRRREILVAVAGDLAAEARQVLHQRDELVLGHAALEGDALDLVVLQLPDELAHRRAELVHRRVGDDHVVADDPDGDRRLLLVQRPEHRDQPRHVARDERVVRRVELRVPDAGRGPAQQVLVEGGAIRAFAHLRVTPAIS